MKANDFTSGFWLITITLWIHLTTCAYADLQFNQLPLCFPEHVLHHYTLDDPPNCDRLNWAETKPFIADIFTPTSVILPVPATVCTVETVVYADSEAFLGSKTTDQSEPVKDAPSEVDCRSWAEEHYDSSDRKLGRFSRTEAFLTANTWATTNKHEPVFYRGSVQRPSVINAIVFNTTLIVNKRTGKVTNMVDPDLICFLAANYCKSKTYMVFLNKAVDMDCPELEARTIMDTEIYLHSYERDSDGNVVGQQYMAAPDVDLAFTSFVECEQRIKKCHSQEYPKMWCTSNHFIVASRNNTLEIGALTKSKKKLTTHIEDINRKQKLYSSWNYPTPETGIRMQRFETLYTMFNQYFYQLKHQLLQIQCHNTRLHLTNLRATQHISPSKTLSTLLNRETYGTMSSGTLQEIHCIRVDATLQDSLRVGSRTTSNPIFTVQHEGQTIDHAQWTNDNYLRIGLRDFLQDAFGDKPMVFRINDRTLLFRNGTLVPEAHPVVTTLGVTTTNISFAQHTINPNIAESMMADAAPPNGMDIAFQEFEKLSAIQINYLSSYTGQSPHVISDFVSKPLANATEQESFLSKMHFDIASTFMFAFVRVITSVFTICATLIATFKTVVFVVKHFAQTHIGASFIKCVGGCFYPEANFVPTEVIQAGAHYMM